MTTSESHYWQWLRTEGVPCLLLLLDYFEYKEMYEECEKIIGAIKLEESHIQNKLPHKMTEDVWDWILNLDNRPQITMETLKQDYAIKASGILASMR